MDSWRWLFQTFSRRSLAPFVQENKRLKHFHGEFDILHTVTFVSCAFCCFNRSRNVWPTFLSLIRSFWALSWKSYSPGTINSLKERFSNYFVTFILIIYYVFCLISDLKICCQFNFQVNPSPQHALKCHFLNIRRVNQDLCDVWCHYLLCKIRCSSCVE